MYSNQYIKIDQNACMGCGGCITACPHDALEFDAEGKSSIKLANVCDGEHECVIFCPIGALTQNQDYKQKVDIEEETEKMEQIVNC
ncbi:[FeFe]-hydrogenase [Hexamita inflata]|uniref:[FeFe]-hydrogenase n=1 Tax=Hexamita inflata TaxID=28002 RepID=A0AA86Q706_9EUKA|nr:[FeFe]-hydrogenase [Hexamita inflata]